MDATFLGEDDADIGVEVTDNNGATHHIELHKDGGEIYAHYCDGYADDPDDRTLEENEHNNQARRFARYYVYRERGYDVLPEGQNPDRIDTVRLALEELPLEKFDSLFGGLYTQLASAFDDTVDPTVTLPPEVTDREGVVYQQNVYLGFDPDAVDVSEEFFDLALEYDLDLTSTPSASVLEDWHSFRDDVAELARDRGYDPSEGTKIAATSGIYVRYYGTDEAHVFEAQNPLERPADARVELPVVGPESLEHFQDFLGFHLRCQVRDCFVGMGVEPPAPFQVLGPGLFEHTVRYVSLEMYPEYHTLEADASRFWSRR